MAKFHGDLRYLAILFALTAVGMSFVAPKHVVLVQQAPYLGNGNGTVEVQLGDYAGIYAGKDLSKR